MTSRSNSRRRALLKSALCTIAWIITLVGAGNYSAHLGVHWLTGLLAAAILTVFWWGVLTVWTIDDLDPRERDARMRSDARAKEIWK